MLIRNNKIIIDTNSNKFKNFILDLIDIVMNKIEKIKSFFVFFILFFAITSSAHATTIIDQQTQTSGNCGSVSQYASSYPFSYYTQRINVGQYNNINQVDVKFINLVTNRDITFYVCSGNLTSTIADATCNGAGQTIATTSQQLISSSTTNYTLDLGAGIDLPLGSNYFISVTSATNFGMELYQNGQVGQYCYSYNIDYPMGGWTPSWLDSRNKSLYFITYTDTEFGQIDDLTTQLISPYDGEEIGFASVSFIGKFRDNNHLANNLVISVYNSDLNQTVEKYFSLASTTSTSTQNFGVSGILTPMNYQLLGNAKWTAWLASGTVKISTNTPENNFITGSTSTLPIANMPINWEQVCNDDDLDTLMGQISCSFKTAVAWTLYPSQTALDNLKNTGSEFKNAFPFNTYFLFD